MANALDFIFIWRLFFLSFYSLSVQSEIYVYFSLKKSEMINVLSVKSKNKLVKFKFPLGSII